MAFSFTDDEKKRIHIAKLAGITLDPIGYADLATIVILSVVYFLNIISVIFLLYNRSYAPLKSKYPIMMSCCTLGMFIWFLGDLVLKSHVHVQGLLSNCMVFLVWMRVLCGNFMVSALISVRSYALFCVFRKNRAYKGKYVWFSGGLVGVVGLIFLLITYVMPENNTVHYIEAIQMCNMSFTYRAIVQGLLWATWTVNAVINYRLRNITSSFNESREMGVACISVFILLGFNTIILYAYPLYPTRTILRVSETLLSHFIANFLWWFIMFRGIYNCATRRSAYLVEWKEKLVSDGLQKQYQISRTDPFAGTMISIGSQMKGGGGQGGNGNGVGGQMRRMHPHDTRMSFSRGSSSRAYQQQVDTVCDGDEVSGAWYNGHRYGAGSIMSSEGRVDEDDNSNIMLFSPQRVNTVNGMENISSATTIHDGSHVGQEQAMVPVRFNNLPVIFVPKSPVL